MDTRTGFDSLNKLFIVYLTMLPVSHIMQRVMAGWSVNHELDRMQNEEIAV
jgi:hypothetical protein